MVPTTDADKEIGKVDLVTDVADGKEEDNVTLATNDETTNAISIRKNYGSKNKQNTRENGKEDD